jgi:hypothetical protein
MADDMIAYSGLPRDRHRALKVYCAATDQTIGGFRVEAVAQKLGQSPGIDAIEDAMNRVREAIAQAEAPTPLPKNGKKNGK